MEVTVHTRLDEVAAADWERLAAGRTPYHRFAWLQAAPPPGELRLLVARRGGEPVGLLPLYLLDAEGHYYHSPRQLLCGFREEALLAARGRSVAAMRAAAAVPWLPAALAAVPYGYRGGVIAPADAPAAAATAASLAGAAGELCRRRGMRLLLHYGLLGGADDTLLAALGDRGRRPFVAGAHCDLDVRWPVLDDYFRDLGERGRRLRSRHRRAAAAGDRRWRLLTRRGGGFPRLEAAEAAALFAGTAQRHGDPHPPASLYRALLDAPPPLATGPRSSHRHLLLGESPDGHLTSALLAIEEGGILYPKLFGSRVREDYFFLTYSRLVELAIARGARSIAYGGGGHQAKLLRGARLRWLLASVEVFDRRLAAPLLDLLPHYEAAKVEHFSTLASRFQADHTPPPRPLSVGYPPPSPPPSPPPLRHRSPIVAAHATEKGAPP